MEISHFLRGQRAWARPRSRIIPDTPAAKVASPVGVRKADAEGAVGPDLVILLGPIFTAPLCSKLLKDPREEHLVVGNASGQSWRQEMTPVKTS